MMQIPPEFEAVLSSNTEAKTLFDRLPPSHRSEYINWISEGKREDTRKSRAAKAIEMLLDSK